MRFDFLCLRFFKWEIGIMLGDDTATIPIIKLELVVLGFGFKLLEISV
jgi:hypothetical protein